MGRKKRGRRTGGKQKRAAQENPGRSARPGADGPDVVQALGRAGGPDGAPELWARLAWLPLFALVGALLYLGSRPGGTGPIFVFMGGRLLIGLCSLVLFLWGLGVALRRRPLLQRGRLRAFVIVVLVLVVSNYPFPFPSSREGRPSTVSFRLPVEGEWVVLWGGEGREANRLAGFYADRRWGMHLVREVEGATHLEAGEGVEAHHCYGEPVFAPADGLVVSAVDGVPDGGPRGSSSQAFGNHLVLQVAPAEFLFLTQLQKGSILPVIGESVVQGAQVARVGASCFCPISPSPHLGIHLQTSSVPDRGEGIPWVFHDYVADGVDVEEGVPSGGVARDGTLLGARVRSKWPSSAD